jgi:hypothetical protein
LRGSGDFFAWADSLLYVRRHRGQILLSVEHRSAPAPEPITLALAGDTDPHLDVVTASTRDGDGPVSPPDRPSLEHAVLSALAAAPLARLDLRARLRVRNERLGEALTRLAQLGAVRRVGDRWEIPDSHSPLP